MWLKLLGDPGLRRAYVVTKVGVVAVAALATVFVARLVGPKAWNGFFIFAALLALLTVAMLVASRASATDTGVIGEADGDEPEEDEPSPDGDEPIVLPIEDSIDLHPFPPADIPAVVSDYLDAAHDRGLREVRLIHGRGIGVQRERVRSLLSRHPLVHSYHDAPPESGGWGATVAQLEDRKASHHDQ